MVKHEFDSAISMAKPDYIFAYNRLGLWVLLLLVQLLYLLSCIYFFINCSFKFRCKLLLMIIANKLGFEQMDL